MQDDDLGFQPEPEKSEVYKATGTCPAHKNFRTLITLPKIRASLEGRCHPWDTVPCLAPNPGLYLGPGVLSFCASCRTKNLISSTDFEEQRSSPVESDF